MIKEQNLYCSGNNQCNKIIAKSTGVRFQKAFANDGQYLVMDQLLPGLVKRSVGDEAKRSTTVEKIYRESCGHKVGNVILEGSRPVYTFDSTEVYFDGENQLFNYTKNGKKWAQRKQAIESSMILKSPPSQDPRPSICQTATSVVRSTEPRSNSTLNLKQDEEEDLPVIRTVIPPNEELPRFTSLEKIRNYQTDLFQQALRSKKSLIAIPTNCGKTLIGIVFMQKILECNPRKKALFIVPRVPLVYQQAKYVQTELGISPVKGCSFTRITKETLTNSKVIVATAQAVTGYIDKKWLRAQDLCCVVFDEAHHATGNHPYVDLLKHINKKVDLILCLTASPINIVGTTDTTPVTSAISQARAELNSLCGAYNGAKVIYPKDKDFEEQIKLPEILFVTVSNTSDQIEKIRELNIQIRMLMQERKQERKQEDINLSTLYQDFYATPIDDERERINKAIQLFAKIEAIEIFGVDRNHPSERLATLIKIVQKASSSSDQMENRILVFVKTRATGKRLVDFLRENFGGMNAEAIFGQQGEHGMTPAQQQNVLKGFDEGRHKVLVATSVVEEGLDVPQCSIVVAFDPICSVRSMVQIRGRARSGGSKFYAIGKQEHKKDLAINIRKEEIIICAVKKMAAELVV